MAHDVIVIGAGVMGLSTAAELSRRGQRVLLLEQFDLFHALGSSHGQTRVIRTAYYEHPNYVPLAQRSWQLWRTLGPDLVHKTGGLYMGAADCELIAGSLAAARKHDLQFQLLEPRDVRNRFPGLHVPDGVTCFWEEDCGLVMAADALRTFAASDIEIQPNSTVESWETSDAGVSVSTSTGTFQAQKLVLCGGPWSTKLLAKLDIPLSVTRQVVGFASTAPDFTEGSIPVTCFESRNGTFYYTIPSVPSAPLGMKIGCHTPGTPVSIDNVNRQTTAEDAELLNTGLREFFPAAGDVQTTEACLYTNTPDAHFIIDRHPTEPNVVFACGFSGHGFKFAPVVGEALADLAIDCATSLPIDFLSLRRFR